MGSSEKVELLLGIVKFTLQHASDILGLVEDATEDVKELRYSIMKLHDGMKEVQEVGEGLKNA